MNPAPFVIEKGAVRVSVQQRVAGGGVDRLRAAHRAFWHRYYPASFVSLPDARLERFYWIQMYKLASATRAGGLVIDNQGPWYRGTPWPGLWWNLNVQLSYWPTYAANRATLAISRASSLDAVSPIMDMPPSGAQRGAVESRTWSGCFTTSGCSGATRWTRTCCARGSIRGCAPR